MASKSNLISSVNHRFISRSDSAIRVHVHLPNDTLTGYSIGFVKKGEQEAMSRALKLRDEIGEKEWGEYWPRILDDRYFFTRLPENLEPRLMIKSGMECYIATFSVLQNGKLVKKSAVRSTHRRGKAGAYRETKEALIEAHQGVIDILLFMGRITQADLSLTLPEKESSEQ